MTDGGRLQGVRVLVTRPASQAATLCRLVESEGGVPLRLPLLSIEPVFSPALARLRLATPADCWIFTSANAVRHAAPLVAGVAWPPRVAAIGPATAAALGGAPTVTLPLEGASSESLLALPELADLRGQRVLLITGEGGLGQLEPALAARGAAVDRAEVYRRVPLPYPGEVVLSFLRRCGVVVVTSGEALEHLLRLVPGEARPMLRRKPLVLPSARVVERARELGLEGAESVEGPMSDAALLAACERVAKSR